MNGAALNAYPFSIRRQPREQDIESPPRRQEKVGSSVIDDPLGIGRLAFATVEDGSEIAVERAEDRPIEVAQKREIAERPQDAPVAVGSAAAGEDVEAQRWR